MSGSNLLQRRVQFYETDTMSYVHHSNYLRYFEEVRSQWGRERKLRQEAWGGEDVSLVVLETHLEHVLPAKFDDLLEVQMQVRLSKAHLEFEYKVINAESKALVCKGRTVHAPIDKSLQLKKPPRAFVKILSDEIWKDDWLK